VILGNPKKRHYQNGTTMAFNLKVGHTEL